MNKTKLPKLPKLPKITKANLGNIQYYRSYEASFKDVPKTTQVIDDNLPWAIICDLDGTLANNTERRKYLQNGNKDWEGFNNTIETDVVNDWCEELLYSLRFFEVILVSGRSELSREKTLEWLEKNHVKYNVLLMRKAEDYRKDDIIKQEIYDNEIKGKYNVLFCIDDRRSVVDMWRRNGLVCLQCDVGDI